MQSETLFRKGMHYSVRLAQMLQTCITSIFKNACRKRVYESHSDNILRSPIPFSHLPLWKHPAVSTAVLCLVAQSCPALCNPADCSPLGSTVHGILQARILEWVAMPSSRGSSQPRDPTQASHVAGRFFTSWATRDVQKILPFPSYNSSLETQWPNLPWEKSPQLVASANKETTI